MRRLVNEEMEIMAKVYIDVLKDYIEVLEDGRFELPPRLYSPAELKRIAREVNRAIRDSKNQEGLDDMW